MDSTMPADPSASVGDAVETHSSRIRVIQQRDTHALLELVDGENVQRCAADALDRLLRRVLT